eukprot:11429735-Karenia_brevis.AAC.1
MGWRTQWSKGALLLKDQGGDLWKPNSNHGIGLLRSLYAQVWDWDGACKQGKMSQTGALMAVLTEALWPGANLEAGDPMHNCQHCQKAGYDELHMFYTCPSRITSRHPMIQKNNNW